MNRITKSMDKMLLSAMNNKYAIPQININNLEWIVATLESAQEMRSPIILGVSEGAAKYMCGFKNVVDMVNNVIQNKNITIPVAVHLDHGSYEGCLKAIEAGFSSIMFDGSIYKFDENLMLTKKLLNIIDKKDISLEVEVGSIGGEEDGHQSRGELADPKECQEISNLNITCLAAGIGNIHGIYPSDWAGLNFQQLIKIVEMVKNKPIALHGGTGISTDQIKKAISLGVSKINVNTECQLAFASGIRKYIENENDLDTTKKGFDPRKLLKPGILAIKEVVTDKIKIFGSAKKA